jgi:hypothetical protein
MARHVVGVVLGCALLLGGCEEPVCSATPSGGRFSGWVTQVVTGTHVVDGRFGPDEWAGATRLEGVLTDVYLDYRDGYLYVLNDWRAGAGDIRTDCFNRFDATVGRTNVEIRVYGDDHIEVDGLERDGNGAYGYGTSPTWDTPHTIYEFRLAVPDGPIAICCLDPTTSSTCEELATEPVHFSLEVVAGGVRVARGLPSAVRELGPGASCGRGEGVCGRGMRCDLATTGVRVCTSTTPALDAGVLPLDAGLDAPTEEDAGARDAGEVDAEPPM